MQASGDWGSTAQKTLISRSPSPAQVNGPVDCSSAFEGAKKDASSSQYGTGKRPSNFAQQSIIEVAEMDETVALQLQLQYLINRDLVTEDQATKPLLAELIYLPQATLQVAAYINKMILH